MSSIKKNYLVFVLALLLVVLSAVFAKVACMSAAASQVTGKIIAENFESSSPALAKFSFEPHVFMIAFLIMVGSALGMVLLHSQMKQQRKKDMDEEKSECEDEDNRN